MNEILRRPRQQLVPVRWWIFGFLFAIGFLEYLQQRALTIAAEPMIPALHLSQMQIGWLEQAFVIGYMLFQIPGGVLGQRWGARWMFLADRHRLGALHRRHRIRAGPADRASPCSP